MTKAACFRDKQCDIFLLQLIYRCLLVAAMLSLVESRRWKNPLAATRPRVSYIWLTDRLDTFLWWDFGMHQTDAAHFWPTFLSFHLLTFHSWFGVMVMAPSVVIFGTTVIYCFIWIPYKRISYLQWGFSLVLFMNTFDLELPFRAKWMCVHVCH